MRIGIDARFAVAKNRRGIGTYSVHLLNSLTELAADSEFILYTDCEDVEGVLPLSSNVKVRRLWPAAYPLWEQAALPFAVYRDDLDLLHTLGNTAPIWLPRRTKLVISLMDVMFLQSGDFIPLPTTLYQRAGRLYRSLISPLGAFRALAVITISEFSRKDILALLPGLPSRKITPIHLACDPLFSREKSYNSKTCQRPFILCLGAEDPRKNTLRIVQAYLHALTTQRLEQDLIVCGYTNWEGSSAHRLVQNADAEPRVRFLSFASAEDLSALYQQSSAFLYVSLYEGFGIPILEAFSSGCPVIASNTTSIPEVGGDAAIYVDPTNVSAIADAIVRLCTNPLLRFELVERGRTRAKEFSWKKVARETLEVYRRVLDLTEGPGE